MPQSPALIRASPGTLRRPISGLRSRTVAEHIANPARAGDMLRLARGGRALLTHALSSGRWSVRGYVRVLYSSGGPLTRRPSALPFGRALPSSGGGSSGSGRRAAVVNWPGRATLFWWQLGVLKHLQQAYPGLVETTPMMGFSGGSFAAAFAACGVDPDRALQTAHRLCVERGAYSRPLGLLGVWGFIIRDWLDELLPDDAAERCSGVTSIFVTQLPSMRNVALDRW